MLSVIDNCIPRRVLCLVLWQVAFELWELEEQRYVHRVSFLFLPFSLPFSSSSFFLSFVSYFWYVGPLEGTSTTTVVSGRIVKHTRPKTSWEQVGTNGAAVK